MLTYNLGNPWRRGRWVSVDHDRAESARRTAGGLVEFLLLQTRVAQPSLPFEIEPALELPVALPPPAPLVFVRHPRARRYVLRVTRDGQVRVTVPRWGSKRDAAAFAEGQRAWIDRQRRRLAQEHERPRPVPLDPHEQRALVDRATRELPPRLLELAAQHSLTVTRISIRNQRSRWGSCSRTGHICLNWRLVQMPDHVRDYVLLHELMHLKRMDHSPAFWALVRAVCPDVDAARTWLRTFGRGPHAEVD